MDARCNVPVHLQYHDDGTVSAKCPMLDCQCRSPSRMQALRTMRLLIKESKAKSKAPLSERAQKYEVVFLAVGPFSQDGRPPVSKGDTRPRADIGQRWKRMRAKCAECLDAAERLEVVMKTKHHDAS
ncbi:hypothetical protein [Pendulispora albinea]|uniref:Uncharacterized protein n=1 Tax=Pendulispora albinea TaxID=2741071 RepID=A0ABZ2LWF9_9BACT